jgi:hypothetical protein
MMTKSTAFSYFLFGLLCGFLLGVSLEKEASSIVGWTMSAGAMLFVAIFSRRLESLSHKRHLENWEIHRRRGQTWFILSRYICVRGLAIIILFVGPFVPALRYSTLVASVLLLTAIPLVVTLSYIGHEEWVMCEQDYEVILLKQAAERARQQISQSN